MSNENEVVDYDTMIEIQNGEIKRAMSLRELEYEWLRIWPGDEDNKRPTISTGFKSWLSKRHG